MVSVSAISMRSISLTLGFLNELFSGYTGLSNDFIPANNRLLRPVSSLHHNLGDFLDDTAASLGIVALFGE